MKFPVVFDGVRGAFDDVVFVLIGELGEEILDAGDAQGIALHCEEADLSVSEVVLCILCAIPVLVGGKLRGGGGGRKGFRVLRGGAGG